ncbi:MAG: hypothetical protein QM744_14350 [Mesorhizobium sp.]
MLFSGSDGKHVEPQYVPPGPEKQTTLMNGQNMNQLPLAEYLKIKKGMM